MKKEFDVDNLSKSELRMLLSVMEGELEARDVVIEALRNLSALLFKGKCASDCNAECWNLDTEHMVRGVNPEPPTE
ncbi:hypothetical protein ACRRTK_015706 [Alexandromys fortis]